MASPKPVSLARALFAFLVIVVLSLWLGRYDSYLAWSGIIVGSVVLGITAIVSRLDTAAIGRWFESRPRLAQTIVGLVIGGFVTIFVVLAYLAN